MSRRGAFDFPFHALKTLEEQIFEVRLKGSLGAESLPIAASTRELPIEGAVLENLSETELEEYEIEGGVRVQEINAGKWLEMGMEDGFIITHIDGERIDNTEDLRITLEHKSGSEVVITGITSEGDKSFYTITW